MPKTKEPIRWVLWRLRPMISAKFQWEPYAMAISLRFGYGVTISGAQILRGYITSTIVNVSCWRILPYGKLPRCEKFETIKLPKGWPRPKRERKAK